MRRKNSTRGRLTAKRKRRSRLRLLFIVLTLIFLSCVYIWQRVTVITLSAQTKELRLETKRMQEVHKYLEIEVANLISVPRIEKKGMQMGLAYPSLDQIGLIRELPDSTYLETQGFAKNVWARLRALRKTLLPGDEALAKEIENEP